MESGVLRQEVTGLNAITKMVGQSQESSTPGEFGWFCFFSPPNYR